MIAETEDIVFLRGKEPGTVITARVTTILAKMDLNTMKYQNSWYRGHVLKTGKTQLVEFDESYILDVLKKVG